MPSLIFDVETNGFLDELDRIHSLVVIDADTGEMVSVANPSGGIGMDMEDQLRRLMAADALIGHNIIKFDIPAIQKVCPWFKPKGRIMDTVVVSKLLWPDMKERDAAKRKVNPHYIEGKLVGSHSLKALGIRMGIHKGDYDGGFERWSPDMQSYCEQDVRVNEALWKREQKLLEEWPEEVVDMEMSVQAIIARQERYGFAFDTQAGAKLYAEWSAIRSDLEKNLSRTFHPWFRNMGHFVPKRDNKKMGYVEGAPFTKIKLTEFNPGSRDHVADRLKKLHGWKPQEFTPDGKPKVDEAVLNKLPYDEAQLLVGYFTLQKRIGMLAEGKNAWLLKEKRGRIHGGVNTLGAVTRRMTHLEPNLAQVPASRSPYGEECRSLFGASTGTRLVGCDAAGLELRCLAGYMFPWDQGAYVETVLEGDRDRGTDCHSVNCRAIGMDPEKLYPVDGKRLEGRDIAKTWFYAFIYGAGDEKLGWIMGRRGDPSIPDHWGKHKDGQVIDKIATAAGKQSRANVVKNLPALGSFIKTVKERSKSRGYLKSVDGGRLVCRSVHSAPNTLLQSAGAIFMKKALVILDDTLQASGLCPGSDYEFVANVHDEWQIEVQEDHVETVKQQAAESIRLAGEAYQFECPLAGKSDAGENWAQTH